MQETEVIIKRKLGIVPKIFLLLITVIFLFYFWMRYVETKFITVHDEIIYTDKVSHNYDGFTIVHFSDIHFGRTTNEKEVNKVVEGINECKPDIVLFSGDLFDPYITLSDSNISFLKEAFSKINANIKKYAVLGDQDYINEEAYTEIMKEANFKLINEKNEVIYYNESKPIYIAGSDSIIKSEVDIDNVLKNNVKNDLQLFLSHEPVIVDELDGKVDFVFAGHSLGGLIRLPFAFNLFKNDNIGKYVKGKYILNDTIMFVNNGIGTENYSLRLFNLPTIDCYRFVLKNA